MNPFYSRPLASFVMYSLFSSPGHWWGFENWKGWERLLCLSCFHCSLTSLHQQSWGDWPLSAGPWLILDYSNHIWTRSPGWIYCAYLRRKASDHRVGVLVCLGLKHFIFSVFSAVMSSCKLSWLLVIITIIIVIIHQNWTSHILKSLSIK